MLQDSFQVYLKERFVPSLYVKGREADRHIQFIKGREAAYTFATCEILNLLKTIEDLLEFGGDLSALMTT